MYQKDMPILGIWKGCVPASIDFQTCGRSKHIFKGSLFGGVLNFFIGMFYKSRPLGLIELILLSLSHHLPICYQIINDYINDSVCITKMSLDYG